MAAKPIRLIVGLGNPGAEYSRTRHNAGAWFCEEILRANGCSAKVEARFFGQIGKVTINAKSVYVLIPSTYMNDSGRSVLAVAQFYKLAPEEILVAHDELDHEAGNARLKFAGGHGGHNGLRDISRVMGNQFARLRLGIGHPGDRNRVTSYVLGKPPTNEADAIDHAIRCAYDVLPDLVANGGWNKAVKNLHTD